MEESSGPGLQEILAGIRRRVLMIAGVFVAGSILAAAVAYSLPATYSSTAKVLVESQQIPNDLARSTVTASAAERLQIIQQVLMTRENLLDIAADLDLFADRPNYTPSDRVAAMREATEIQPITIGRRTPQVTAFTITYRAGNPSQTSAVANELVTRVLEQNLRQRSLRATQTNEFFKAEIDRLSQQIVDTERELVAFKNENRDRLPEGQESRQRELVTMQDRQFEREKRRFQLEEQKRNLTETLANGLPVDARQMSPEERELMELQRTLTMRRAVLAPSHPQIRALERRIEVIEGLVQPAATDGEDKGPSLAEQRITRQLELLDRELDLMNRQEEADRARRVALEEAIQAAPPVAMALGDMTRRYDDLKYQREAAMRKQVEAAMGERLEVTQKAERFEVIEQAQRPTTPDAPNRVVIAAAGSAGSLGLGLGLAVLLELMNRAIRNPGQLERSTGLRPFVTVPWIPTVADRRRRRRQIVMSLAAIAIGVPLLLFLIDQQVMPLPVLADRFIEKSGIGELVDTLGIRFGG